MHRRHIKGFLIAAVSIFGVGAIVFGLFALYASNYYRADREIIEEYQSYYEAEIVYDKNRIAVIPENPTSGFVFYPGGKVDPEAYLPLMYDLASDGVLCVICKMPFNFAFLDSRAAMGIKDDYPEIDRWYIGGHSLGGAMAADYVAARPDDFDGLVLLGAYSAKDLSSYDIDVMTVIASEDEILNHKKYKQGIHNLPDDFIEYEIEGGCHAYFGAYGQQDGDGTPSISVYNQISETSSYIISLIYYHGAYED